MRRATPIALAALAACAPTAPAAKQELMARGERAYQKCYSCHALEPGRNELAGPTLAAIAGRPVAAEPGFDYSPALEALAVREPRWTRSLLDRFVADPEAVAPGTRMTFHGIADPAERHALITYLEARQTSSSAASRP